MLSVLILYTLIAISSILHNEGTIGGLIADSLPKKWGNVINIIVFGFIMISSIGVTNGYHTTSIIAVEEMIESNTLFGFKTLTNKWGKVKVKAFYLGILVFI
jgi:hypothetical protein